MSKAIIGRRRTIPKLTKVGRRSRLISKAQKGAKVLKAVGKVGRFAGIAGVAGAGIQAGAKIYKAGKGLKKDRQAQIKSAQQLSRIQTRRSAQIRRKRGK